MELNSNSTDLRNERAVVSTVDSKELKQFNMQSNWWAGNSGYILLHTLNKIRIPFITKSLIDIGKLNAKVGKSARPLEGLRILDVGCGGGFLTEELAKLGAETVGLDIANNLLKVAKDHMRTLDPSIKLKYVESTIEEYSINNKNSFDVVVSSEVVEHVFDQEKFVSKCVDCVKPEGSIVFTTIDRNILSKMYMLWFCEYITGVIPLGTHHYEKFITPGELTKMLKTNGCIPKNIEGLTFNPVTKAWFTIPTTKLNYAIHAIKSFN